ncbi:helix-turn-helix transcriptional regulator [Actinomadura sp. KC345]|uniref:AAA family ATPase n=2 Tax=unclassified Actinomadura TaxID=2626254 RepID=UPI00104779A1|nr:LuxR family transcriptional regulator [Actinomadura sp. KC345]TDC58173.1 helix-turn-helix transcriptional regulator [Actinomadura sp. KC345]
MVRQALYGRGAEVAEIDRLVGRARGGAGGGVLILRGEAGIGKTALLDHAHEVADGMRVLRGSGIEAEAEVPFAALHLLLGDRVLGDRADRFERLPAPQAAALRAALGLARPRAEDRLLVGLALLTLLGGPGADTPVLCLVDDAQWLDRESADALLFAARRVAARNVVFLIAVRDDIAPRDDATAWSRAGLPERRLTGLDAEDARLLLDERAPHVPAGRRDRVVEQARGNPLALIEFAGAGAGRPAQVPVEFERAVRDLPEPARVLLAVVAADDTGEPGVAVRAARSLGVPFDALEAAESAGLVAVTRAAIGFRHPLARAAAYQGVPVTRRIAVHRALAEVHAHAGDADLRVRHLAAAALGTDEAVAAELEAAAGDIRDKDGPPAAAFAYERAARLAGDPEVRARRLASAAEGELAGGRPDRARALADEAVRADSGQETAARADLVRAGIELEHGVPQAAGRLLLDRAGSCDDPAIHTRMLEEAVVHAWSCGDRETAVQARDRHEGWRESAVMRGLSAALDGDLADAGRLLGDMGGEADERLRLLGAEVALLAGDDAAAGEMSARLVGRCRERGLLSLVPRGLGVQAWSRLFHGAHDDARALTREALEIAEEAGQHRQAAALRAIQARQAAVEGDEVRCRALSADGRAGDALGLLALGLGRPEDALEHLQDTHRHEGHDAQRVAASGPLAILALADTVEAAVASGRPGAGEEPMARLAAFARNARQPWADGVASRCRALLTGDAGEEAERHFALALASHRLGGRPFERARTELLYGEWLRRSRRRAQARVRLGAALEIFERLGAVPWAERARGELRAAGQGVRSGGDDPPGRLTAQEMQVVRLAMTGATNRQIAARLRLSHRTVAYHLYKAFPKLGVASRAELHRCVPALEAGADRPA